MQNKHSLFKIDNMQKCLYRVLEVMRLEELGFAMSHGVALRK